MYKVYWLRLSLVVVVIISSIYTFIKVALIGTQFIEEIGPANPLTTCIENIVFEKSFILLLDKNNNVRGYFDSADRGEIERLDVEIDILKLEK